MIWYFVFFFISGFCSILYELVWLRLAMAQFGATTALVSIVLSTFMAGLGAGSWISGRLLRKYDSDLGVPSLRLYGLSEFLIGASAFLVPIEFRFGHKLLQGWVPSGVSSFTYYLASGVLVVAAILPWCACMGATIPLAMASIRARRHSDSRRSFSFLYISNVFGALLGAFIPLLLIEKYGFTGAWHIGAFLNCTIAITAWAISGARQEQREAARELNSRGTVRHAGRAIPVLLFLTGFSTMAMELIWIRLFTPYVGVVVYSFAAILFCYLLGTFIGSCVYRDEAEGANRQGTWIMLPLFGALPALLADPRVHVIAVFRVLGIAPFAAAVGYLTPMLIDRWAIGNPDRAGRAYAVNILGCIFGPLLSGFVLLPLLGEHLSMLLLVLPWVALAAPWRRFRKYRVRQVVSYISLAASIGMLMLTRNYEKSLNNAIVLRDSTATVTATGLEMEKMLLVNGVGMTHLQPTTKMMAHLTLSSLQHPPRKVLVICFGMGTTYRSVTSWGVPVTAVELVPSVPKLFPFYHADAEKVLRSPSSGVVIDDGRRYLERSTEEYDAIIIDPPPPVSAAGSSLLYSKEFYAIAKQHLTLGGILQQWLPGTGDEEQASVARALAESFPYVRVFPALEPWGWHFLASMEPIPTRTAAELVQCMPAAAATDMVEWGPARMADEQLQLLLSREMKTAEMIALSPKTPALVDNQPVTEYFLLRSGLFRRRAEKPVETARRHID